MKTIVLVALLAAAGCTKKGSDCDASIAKGIEALSATVKDRAPNPQMQENMMNIIGKLKVTLTQRCTEDKWAPEALSCFTTVTSQKDMRGCEEKLTPEQRTKLTAEIQQVMMSSMRMPPGAGHPPTLGGSGSAANPGSDPGAAGGAGAAPAGAGTPPPPATPPAGGAAAPPAATPPAATPPAGSAAAADGSAAKGGW